MKKMDAQIEKVLQKLENLVTLFSQVKTINLSKFNSRPLDPPQPFTEVWTYENKNVEQNRKKS